MNLGAMAVGICWSAPRGNIPFIALLVPLSNGLLIWKRGSPIWTTALTRDDIYCALNDCSIIIRDIAHLELGVQLIPVAFLHLRRRRLHLRLI
jgi:hypothetical protein